MASELPSEILGILRRHGLAALSPPWGSTGPVGSPRSNWRSARPLPGGAGFGWLWLGFGWRWLWLSACFSLGFRPDFGMILGLGWLWLRISVGFRLLAFIYWDLGWIRAGFGLISLGFGVISAGFGSTRILQGFYKEIMTS